MVQEKGDLKKIKREFSGCKHSTSKAKSITRIKNLKNNNRPINIKLVFIQGTNGKTLDNFRKYFRIHKHNKTRTDGMSFKK